MRQIFEAPVLYLEESPLIKIIFMLKRKAGITHEQFRDHYEASHVKLANKYFSHLMSAYRRHYCIDVRGFRSMGASPSSTFNWDCITEWWLPSEEALDEIYRLFSVPEIHKEFHDDEDRFLDREAVVSIRFRESDMEDTGVRLKPGESVGATILNEQRSAPEI